MMNCLLPSREFRYDSLSWHRSQRFPDVSFAVRKISLAERIKLTCQVKDLIAKHEFLLAGDLQEQSEAAVADLLTKRLYLEWGLVELKGLRIDQCAATPEILLHKGPELLTDEIVSVIRNSLELTEQERKNF